VYIGFYVDLQLAGHLQEHASSAGALPGLHSVLLPYFLPGTRFLRYSLVACGATQGDCGHASSAYERL